MYSVCYVSPHSLVQFLRRTFPGVLGVNSSVSPQTKTLETELEMFGVSDHLQLRLEATPSLEAAKLALAVCMEKVSKMLEAALEAENHNTVDALNRCKRCVADDKLVDAVGRANLWCIICCLCFYRDVRYF